ncbi:MAG: hypothetical protein IIT64_10110 [Bacteroidaceae bacterium]|nr:hypothetical protein [Bacteroidaceae bacterium]
MTVEEWVKSVSRKGGVCQPYMRKIAAAGNKTEMFRVLCDVNGGAWLFDLHEQGVPLPIEQFIKEYGAYVNGGKTVEYPSGYTSSFYCRHNERLVVADTTIVYLLECKEAKVNVPMNKYPTVVLSHGSSAEITMGAGSRLNIELYGDAEYTLVDGDKSKVRIMQH